MTAIEPSRGMCRRCGSRRKLRHNGYVPKHKDGGVPCAGGGQMPVDYRPGVGFVGEHPDAAICVAHMEMEPCSTCRSYIAAGL